MAMPIIMCLVALFCYFEPSLGINPKRFNLTTVGTHWSSAGATWYGAPDGAGSTGGSCGYGGAVSEAPFSSFITSVGPSLYKAGQECGACFQVKCIDHPSCSGKPVRVVITDSCPGCPDNAHFDLSGTSFGAMALPGQQDKLRAAGVLQVRFARVACDYAGKTIAFHVDSGSNPFYLSVVVEFEEGDGDLGGVAVREEAADSGEWRAMQQLWGADWKLDAGAEMKPPFSIQLTSKYSGQTLVAKNVIPAGWTPGATYRSVVNFL